MPMLIENKASLNKRIASKRYSKSDKDYFKFLQGVEKRITPTEALFQFGLYIGEENLSRYLSFYELYKKTQNLRGNCCDIGIWKGSSFLFIAKLIKIFEPNSKTKIYGFDWFKGQKPTKKDDQYFKGMHKSSYQELLKNIAKLKLQKYTVLKKMDLTKDFNKYLSTNSWLEFKYAFIDCGSSDVLETSIKSIWPKIVNGGVMVLDHAGLKNSPRESEIVKKYIGNHKIEQLSFSGHPSAYVVKKK